MRAARIVLVLGFLSFTSCGGVEDTPVPAEMSEPVRIETTAATFIVRESVAPDFAKLLAGQPTEGVYYAGMDVP